MQNGRQSTALFAAALALVAAASWMIGAGRASSVAQATAVAVVDFERVFNSLEEVKDLGRRLEEAAEKYTQEVDALTKQIAAEQADLDTMRSDDPKRLDRVMRRTELEVQRKARAEMSQLRLNLEHGRIVADMYRKFGQTLETIARRDGWDLILLDDRRVPLPPPDRQQREAVTAAITEKKVLHAVERVDITAQVITVMNNEFAAGGR